MQDPAWLGLSVTYDLRFITLWLSMVYVPLVSSLGKDGYSPWLQLIVLPESILKPSLVASLHEKSPWACLAFSRLPPHYVLPSGFPQHLPCDPGASNWRSHLCSVPASLAGFPVEVKMFHAAETVILQTFTLISKTISSQDKYVCYKKYSL